MGDTGKVVNSFKVMQAKRQLRVWFEYVPSAQNIADLPSRRAWREFYKVIDSVSGGSWTCFRYRVVVPSYESWLSPLAGFWRFKETAARLQGRETRGSCPSCVIRMC